MATTPRELAYRILLTAEREHSRYIDDILGEILNTHPDLGRERGWITELVYGSTRMKFQLDAIISSVFKGKYGKAQHAVRVLLRMGAFQLLQMNVSDHAAVNETVSLARKVGQARSAGLVNAVLRAIQSLNVDEDVYPSFSNTKKMAVQGSHPEWMIERWVDRYGVDQVQELCAYNNRAPQTWIRRNVLRVERNEFETFLERAGVSFRNSEILDQFYLLESAADLIGSEAFEQGWFSFQDIAAGMVASLVTPVQGEIILDACSAPGGKLTFIAENYSDKLGSLIAMDASNTRLKRVDENVQRLGLKDITISQADVAVDNLPQADWILLDVPCSGTGVLGRRPDARWRKQLEDINSLGLIQEKIIRNAWKHLRAEGSMIYATCSLEPEENWMMIDSVLNDLDNAELVPIQVENLEPYVDERGALSTLPWRDDMDGMFAVILRKKP